MAAHTHNQVSCFSLIVNLIVSCFHHPLDVGLVIVTGRKVRRFGSQTSRGCSTFSLKMQNCDQNSVNN